MVAGLLTFINRWHFSGLAFVWLFVNHSNKLVEQLSMELTTFFRYKGCTVVCIASKIKTINRSQMKMLKSEGPKMDPCEILNKIFFQKLCLTLIFVLGCLLKMHLQINLNVDKLNSYAFNLARSSLWGRNLIGPLTKRQKIYPQSTAHFHFSIKYFWQFF